MSTDELKAAYDQAVKVLVERYRTEVLKKVFAMNMEEDAYPQVNSGEINASQFLEENAEAIKALSRADCIELLGKIENGSRSDWE